MTYTEPTTNTSITLVPTYRSGQPRQDQNRLIYPSRGGVIQDVHTFKAIDVKQDIIINKFAGDSLKFGYKLQLPSGVEARMESNGSLGIYGVDPSLLGNVSAGSDADKALLENARKNGEKNNLLFSFPAPFIREVGKVGSQARAWYSLKDDVLTVHANNLEDASYPLSIDPTVYIETARKLMRGNNESNIDFDVDNELIQKGKTTGARFDNWVNNSVSLPTNLWNHATAVAGGYVYVAGGNNGTSDSRKLYWARFNTTNGEVEAANPGSGACSGWCEGTDSTYNLPVTLKGHTMVSYNGFLYVFGGENSTCTVGNGTGDSGRCKTVYISKLGANGEPALWHPSDANKSNWVYWYSSTKMLSSPTSYGAAAAYNNRMYFVGGKTTATPNGVATVSFSEINPAGDLVAWTTTGMTQLSSGAAARHNHALQIYNDRMYVIGGASATTAQSTVYYIKLNNDGTMTGNWITTTPFQTARLSWGGNMSTIWGGYIYVTGGSNNADCPLD